jgi:hypothetical protein
MDPSEVPGVILSNRRFAAGDYALNDVTSTVLAHFGLANAPGMKGRPIPAR